MRKIIVLCSFIAALCACSKEHAGGEALLQGDQNVEVAIKLDATTFETKATADEEIAVKKLEVFAYNSFGKLVGYKEASTTSSFSINVVPGDITFYALANNKTLIGESGAKDVATLLSKTDALASDYTVESSGIPMYGKSEETSVTVSGSTVSIELVRNLARIDVCKITNATTGVLAVNPITVKEIWLSNVVGSYKIDGACVADLWYNKAGSEVSVKTAPYYHLVSSTLSSGANYSTKQVFYTCANANTNEASDVWAAAATYFNLKCVIADEDYCFNFKLPALVANNVYKITEVKICGTGPLVSAMLTFTFKDWTEVIVGENGVVAFGE